MSDYKLTEYENSWAKNASLMFIDNPVGVGYSYAERNVDKINTDASYKKDILKFMLTFYSYWP